MYAHQIANQNFVLVRPSWTRAQALEVLTLERTSRVVLTGARAYLFSRVQFLQILASLQDSDQLSQCFALGEPRPTPVVDAFSDAEDIPERAIIRAGSGILGFYDAALPDPPRVERRDRDSDNLQAQSYALSADFPDFVRLGGAHSLLVSMVRAVGEQDRLSPSHDELSGVEVVVRVLHGFEILEPFEGVLPPPNHGESLPLQFKLRATDAGLGMVRIFAFYKGAPLTALTLTATITESEVVLGPSKAREAQFPAEPVSELRPDLTLLVLENQTSQPNIRFLLSTGDEDLKLHFRRLGPLSLGSASVFFSRFYEELACLPWHRKPEWPGIQKRLQEMGLTLRENFLPPELEHLLTTHRAHIASMLILSEEPWVPWELCFLPAENGFLCERIPMTRWIPGIPERSQFTLNRMGLIFPNDSGQAHGPEEERFLRLFQKQGRTIESLGADFHAIRQAFKRGVFDMLHFGVHGRANRTGFEPCDLVCEDGKFLSPTDIAGTLTRLGRAHPLVFMNGCHTARQERGPLGNTGWPQKFIEAGASAFVGAYWSITDDSAYHFCKAFYSRLFAGQPIVQAMFQARRDPRMRGNPSRLAYTAYAFPFACLRPDSAAGEKKS